MNSSYSESYFQQLNEYLRWQTERIRYLESRIELITQELESLKRQRGVTIERIEYKFDQLKVETLEGTLNLGLSPSGLGAQSLDDATVGGKVIGTNTARSESFARVQRQVYDYLRQSCPEELAGLESEYGIELGRDFADFVVGDLQGQAAQRIEYYLDTMVDPKQPILTQEQELRITDKVIGDIRLAMEQYVIKMNQQGGAADDSKGRK
ncbi:MULTISPECIES: spore germination protein GerPC [unclassified Paenibacillus]|uniref:spore germination protein GerPC n=1 Tax=unclassified Paenibacillus TaxID=185978 RepID=UPI001AE58F53|nr:MULTISPECIES: spore germination protein GerPC [unclassified Paenibacillus]MBP1156200.1 spore germination protein PC [Paenibacillus sp. PvP091]MBP1168414.1 spore germination protein PC [Paenibacillus sp. PvR098]MBP2439442.1 spore germination protein PC [Paenibacillus sp. PvP052]